MKVGVVKKNICMFSGTQNVSKCRRNRKKILLGSQARFYNLPVLEKSFPLQTF
jgi:hypothetical protein